MIDTPRTDAFLDEHDDEITSWCATANFARQLERELTASQARVAELESQLAASRKREYEIIGIRTPQVEREKIELRAQVKELGEALKEANGSFMGSPQSQKRINAALAKLGEGKEQL